MNDMSICFIIWWCLKWLSLCVSMVLIFWLDRCVSSVLKNMICFDVLKFVKYVLLCVEWWLLFIMNSFLVVKL